MENNAENNARRLLISREDWMSSGYNQTPFYKEGKGAATGQIVGTEFYDPSAVSHITQRSEDLYNEVSFNVLESAASGSGEKHAAPSINFTNGAILSSDEVLGVKSKRKKKKAKKPKTKKSKKASNIKHANVNNSKRRKPYLTTVLAFIFLLIAICTCVAVPFINTGLIGSPEVNDSLKYIYSEIESVDSTIIKLNSSLSGAIDEQSFKDSQAMLAELNQAKTDLKDTSDMIERFSEANKDLSSDDKLYLQYAKESVQARQDMINYGIIIYQEANKAIADISACDKYWKDVLDADAKMKESDTLVKTGKTENFKAAADKANQAVALLTPVLEGMKNLAAKDSTYNISEYIKYVELRLESAKADLETCNALAADDAEKANAENQKYLELERSCKTQAEKLDTSPSQVIRTAYDNKIAPTIELYKDARKEAANIDLTVRNYLKM